VVANLNNIDFYFWDGELSVWGQRLFIFLKLHYISHTKLQWNLDWFDAS